jgi:demethylmenaquinone methyltransferase/2-methoxy-6-polyprenyl-1,4-benzoquinol methylase
MSGGGRNIGMDEIRRYYTAIENAFERLAPYYDLIALPLFGVRERVADLITSDVGLKVLDVATGTGAQALAFARRGHTVVGIELSEAMIRVADRKTTMER